MIRLKNGKRTMEARTELQASAFINSGWERVFTVELTDGVPDIALEDNPDGSVPAFDAEGNPIGTVSVEAAVRAQEEAGGEWTKTKINRMAVDELRKLAAESGIENAGESTGAELKDALIGHFGL